MPWLHPLFILFVLLISGCAALVTSPRTSVEAVIRNHLRVSEGQATEADRAPQALPPFFHPVAGKSAVHSLFGQREGRRHEGVDFVSSAGTPLQAAAPGLVIYAGDGIDRYGTTIILKHSGGYFSLYAHLSELLVEVGEAVLPGKAIARSGASGNATGPHLHFEIRKGIKSLDPLVVAAHLK